MVKLETAKYLPRSKGFIVGHAEERSAPVRSIVYETDDGKVLERILSQSAVKELLRTRSLVLPMRGLTLRATYDKFKILRDALLLASGNRVDFYKCIGSTRGTPLHLFFALDEERCLKSMNQCKPVPAHSIESIGKVEGQFLTGASTGALIWSDRSQVESMQIHKYDVTSYYPSIMCDKHFQFPTEAGNFTVVTNADMQSFEHIPFGIYRCTINVPETLDKKLIRQNTSNYYTHWDIKRARELRLEIQMVDVDEDSSFNAILYQTNRACGSAYFRKTVEILFQLKQDQIPFAKDLLNNFWGSLCEKRRKVLESKSNNLVSELRINPVTDIATCHDLDRPYYYSLARLKPFLLAVARYRMSKLIQNTGSACVRVHTDGVFVTKPLSEADLQDSNISFTLNTDRPELGSLRYEGSLTIKIKNRTQYTIMN